MSRSAAPIPVLVIGGYLGSGKTSLVNHLLRVGTGRRTLVLVNDFGALAIDEELIESRDGNVLTLTNGCVCCTMSSPLVDTLREIRASDAPPELLVIETSGVADPLPVAHHAMVPGYTLDGIVVVADAETVRKRAADDLVGRSIARQLRAAHVLVLNKTDLVSGERASAVAEWLAEQAPDAVLLEAEHGRVPVPMLLAADPTLAAEPEEDDHEHPEHVTVAWTSGDPVDAAVLADVLDSLPSDVVRAKGVLHLSDGTVHVLQLVGRRWQLTGLPEGGAPDPTSRMVVIARPGADVTELTEALNRL